MHLPPPAASSTRVKLDHGMTVGRQALPGQVVLDHPNVSRRHAAFEVADGAVVLRDLGGSSGTDVNGPRLRGAGALVRGDRIDIGPLRPTFDGAALTSAWRLGNVELLVRGVCYDLPGAQRRAKEMRLPGRRDSQPSRIFVARRSDERVGREH